MGPAASRVGVRARSAAWPQEPLIQADLGWVLPFRRVEIMHKAPDIVVTTHGHGCRLTAWSRILESLLARHRAAWSLHSVQACPESTPSPLSRSRLGM